MPNRTKGLGHVMDLKALCSAHWSNPPYIRIACLWLIKLDGKASQMNVATYTMKKSRRYQGFIRIKEGFHNPG